MNTMSMIKITLALISATAGMSTNPIKLSIVLTLISAGLMLSVGTMTTVIWFPMVFFLIFVGGILMMFMILSSTLPNEKSKKSKNLMKLITLISLVSIMSAWGTNQNFSGNLKEMALENHSIMVLTSIMLIYLSFCSSMVSSEELPLRKTIMCPQELIL